MKRILSILVLLFLAITPAHAQKTQAAIVSEINVNMPSSCSQCITAAILRSTLIDIVDSYWQSASTVTPSSLSATQPYAQIVASSDYLYCMWDGTTCVPWLTLIASTHTISLTANGQAIPVSPTGNTLTTYSSFNVQATSIYPSNREYVINCGLVANLGSIATNSNEDKVCAYFGTVMESGAINGWAINPLLTIASGTVTSGFIGGQIAEFDINNNSGTDLNTTAGPSGFGAPFASGINVSSGGTNKIGAGMWFSSGTAQQMVRGILFTNTCCGESDIESGDTATALIADWGTRSYALDTLNATYANSYAIRLGNAQAIAARNAANSADVNIIAFNSGNNLVLGLGAGLTLVGSNFGPDSNNSLSTGTSSNGWTGLYLAGSSSGIGKLVAPAAASTYTWTLPAATDTIAVLGTAQSFTATQTFFAEIVSGVAVNSTTNQISYGGTTSSATSSNCSVTNAKGCVILNIAGTTHYVPYF